VNHRLILTEERDGKTAGIDMMFDPLLVDLSNARMVTIKVGEEECKVPVYALGEALSELDLKLGGSSL